MTGVDGQRMAYEEFFRRAILRLRDASKSRGIHSVYSGFNAAFREYYGEDPVPATRHLTSQGYIETAPRRGGVMICLHGEAPESAAQLGKAALARILGKRPRQSEDTFAKVIDELLPKETEKEG